MLGALVETEPDAVSSFAYDPYTSTNSQIVFTWSPPKNNGGSAVLGYSIDFSDGTSVLFDTGALATTYTVTGLTGGQTYTARIAAYNKYGTGLQSATLSVVAAEKPNSVVTGSVSIVGSYAVVTWVAPFANYSPITGYYVQIISNQEGSYLFQSATAHCLEVSAIPADSLALPNIKGTTCTVELE